jgi:hypothetical protein
MFPDAGDQVALGHQLEAVGEGGVGNFTEFVQKNKPTSSFYIRPFVYTSGLGIAIPQV